MCRPTLANIKSLADSLKIYKTMARCYKLEVKFPENVNWDMDMVEYNTHMNILEKIMRHPYLVSKSQIHPSNK
jgi:hypothetical protein